MLALITLQCCFSFINFEIIIFITDAGGINWVVHSNGTVGGKFEMCHEGSAGNSSSTREQRVTWEWMVCSGSIDSYYDGVSQANRIDEV